MTEFVFSRRLSSDETVDFEVGCGALFAAERAREDGSWSRWSVEGASDWVHDDGVELLGSERLAERVVDCLREGPRDAGVVEALVVLHELEVVDLVGPALDQARELGLL
jgi:hypothetical protein